MKHSLFFFSFMLWRTVAFCQCDTSLKPSDNAAVAYRPIGDRCEGAYIAKVGAPTLDIVGFTVGVLAYKLDKNETIKIENTTGADLNVRSSALPINTYYRMDALLPNGKTLDWAIKDVLFDLKIPAGSLGVYAWKGAGKEKVYIPVKPVSSVYVNTDKSYYLVVRPNARVLGVKYRYALVGESLNTYQEVNKTFKSGQAISLSLPQNLHGAYLVEVAAMLESGTDWIKVQYKVAIK